MQSNLILLAGVLIFLIGIGALSLHFLLIIIGLGMTWYGFVEAGYAQYIKSRISKK
jgi:hypothetical protein